MSAESSREVLRVKNTLFIFTHSMPAHHQLLVSELRAAVSLPHRGTISLNIERNTVLLFVPQMSQNVTLILSAHAIEFHSKQWQMFSNGTNHISKIINLYPLANTTALLLADYYKVLYDLNY